MKTQFSTMDIIKALKIPRERLRQWLKGGFIKPDQAVPSQGKWTWFSLLDVYRIALFRKLIERGFKRASAAKAVGFDLNEFRAPIEWHYIGFRMEDGKLRTFILFVPFGDPEDPNYRGDKMDLQHGCLESRADKFSKDWDDLFIVNLIKLRKAVDEALKNLG